MRRRRKRSVCRSLVPEVPVVDRVVRRGVMDLGWPGSARLGRIHDGGKNGVVDFDLLSRVASLRIGVRNDDRHMVPDITNLVVR